MNARSIALIGLVAVMGIGLLMLLRDLLQPPPPARRVPVALASQEIAPGTVITQDMVYGSEPMTERAVVEMGAYRADAVVGLLTTARIAPNDTITGVNAKPIEQVRFTEDFGLEVVAFSAEVDRAVGGDLRPGHIVNLYGTGRGSEGQPFTVLIEPELWVVKVSASGRPVSNATPRPNVETGQLEVEGGDQEQPASMITVATTPEKAFRIIDALGGQEMSAYITLAANQTAALAVATPVRIPTLTPGLDPDLAKTATALAIQLRATPPAVVPVTGGGGTR